MAIHQAIEHAGSRRLTDGGRNSGDRRISVVFYIHASIVDEV
jgi:hypothetical protein